LGIRLTITGSSGYLAERLVERLGADPDCEFVLGLDIRPVSRRVGCPSEFLQFDLTEPWEKLRHLLQSHSINTGLHLAWQFNPIHDARRHRQVDIGGSANFFRAAEAARLRRIVYTSSATAYVNPANPSEPPYLAEETPVTGTPRYLYSKHKAEVDRIAQAFAAEHPEIATLILRPAIVLGPHTRNIVSTMMEWPGRSFPWMSAVRGSDPPMQFISEEDIGEILYRAIKSDWRGTLNCSGDGIIRFSELARALGKRPLPLPPIFIYPIVRLLWSLRLAPFPAGVLDMVRYPWVVDSTRLKTGFGYTPRHTSRQALEAYLEGMAESGKRRVQGKPPSA
jgi:UDP-glucose 4-epimerase